jgi:hypothetical protein
VLPVNLFLAFNGAGADQPFSLFCEQPVASRDIAISLSKHVKGRQFLSKNLEIAKCKQPLIV